MSDRRLTPARHVGVAIRPPVWAEDAALAGGVAVVGAAFALPDPLGTALSVALGSSLAVRRTLPALALAWAAAVAGAHALLLTGPTAAVIAVPVLVHGLARWSRRALARVGLGVALAGTGRAAPGVRAPSGHPVTLTSAARPRPRRSAGRRPAGPDTRA